MIGSSTSHGAVSAGIGTNRSYSSKGLGAVGCAVPGVDPDPIAHPEGPAGVKANVLTVLQLGNPWTPWGLKARQR